MADTQQRLQGLSEQFQKLQTDLQNNIQSRQKLESQQQENKGVQKEFASLDDNSTIYKLVGPVLLKQDKAEAILGVDGRLELIGNQIKEVEKQIKEAQDKSEELKAQIIQAQTEAQEHGAQAQVAA
ncbi:Prefoldin [Mollisia scopiformis]|uniref:Prefoldin n=1 Tax=Mollisia scopiformis TaxID=149040 RepID=A0A194X3A7_MOLSC|nr:Prefoldin [Mollisia scopiformis]KUJ14656.1 Prefoldin [Mollisia scopiformis]